MDQKDQHELADLAPYIVVEVITIQAPFFQLLSLGICCTSLNVQKCPFPYWASSRIGASDVWSSKYQNDRTENAHALRREFV